MHNDFREENILKNKDTYRCTKSNSSHYHSWHTNFLYMNCNMLGNPSNLLKYCNQWCIHQLSRINLKFHRIP